MKTKTAFKVFHGILLSFYILMYSTSVFHLTYKWNLPVTHKQIGIFYVAIITIFLAFNGKTIFKKLKHYFDFSKGKIEMKVFKASVVLMILHFLLSVLTGAMMNFGINTYKFHAMSKYLVPGLIVFHLLSNVYRKYKLHNR